jgi:DNA-binding CsgD family transcriptional regulator
VQKLRYDIKRDEWVLKTYDRQDNIAEIDKFQRVLELFGVGDFFYSISIPEKETIISCSNNVTTVLGYDPDEITSDLLETNIHEDDRSAVVRFRRAALDLYATLPIENQWRYKVQYDYRLQTKLGSYKRILCQSVPFSYPEDELLTLLSVFTDISHIKNGLDQSLAIMRLDQNNSVQGFFRLSANAEKPELSKREKEVLALLLEGKSSCRIATELFLSQATVENHLKRIRAKTKVKSTIELTARALKENWIQA